jgi:hypothetical protein
MFNEDILRDLCDAVPAHRRVRRFAFVACLILAPGVGTTTAVLSAVTGASHKPLAYRKTDPPLSLKYSAGAAIPAFADLGMSQAMRCLAAWKIQSAPPLKSAASHA